VPFLGLFTSLHSPGAWTPCERGLLSGRVGRHNPSHQKQPGWDCHRL